MTTKYREHNPGKHEYEAQPGSSHTVRMVFLGNSEKTALKRAVELLGLRESEDHLRLYHTYPSPGPTRRYCGIVRRDGVLLRAR